MPDIRVNVAGSERAVPEGTTAGELLGRPRRRRRPRQRELRDLAHVLADGDDVEPVADRLRRTGSRILRHSTAHVLAQAVQELFPEAKLGIGPPISDGFYYDFDVETPFTPEDLKAIEKRMQQDHQGGPAVRAPRRLRRRRARRAGRRAVQARADRRSRAAAPPTPPRSVGRGRRRRADHLRQPRRRDGERALEGPVPRPAPADHPAHPGVQADAQRRRVLARQREEPAAAAHLRHRLGDQGRAGGVPAPARGGRAARPPQARRRARPVLASPTRSAPAWRSSTPRAASSGGRWRTTSGAATRRGFEYVGTPHITKEGLFHTSGHLPYYADGMFPPHGAGRAAQRLLPQGR